MIYRQFDPHPALMPYIDAYWIAKGNSHESNTERILPDGCVDITILNPGEGLPHRRQHLFIGEQEKTYLWLAP